MKKTTYPRWIGVLAALILPGSAHYLSGSRSAGIKWFITMLLIPIVSLSIAAIPLKPAIALGLLFSLVLFQVLYLVMLVKSFRSMRRIGFKGWVIFVLLRLAIGVSYPLIGTLATKPYGMPTGSMKPTIRGITVADDREATSLIDWIISGKRYREVRATATGPLEDIRHTADGIEFSIGGEPHRLPHYALKKFRPPFRATEGDLLWAGTVYGGDRIMVEKVSYWIREPRRGDIIVFKAAGIDHPDVRQDTLYVKRIAALPGDTIGIDPPHLLINGEPLAEPAVFNHFEYGNDGQLAQSTSTVTLAQDEYFVLGDNTAPNMSLDSRHFGAITRKSIIGRVSTIYWPFTRVGAVE